MPKHFNGRIDASVAELATKAQSLKQTFAARLLTDRLARFPSRFAKTLARPSRPSPPSRRRSRST